MMLVYSHRALEWRHNEHDGVSNHRRFGSLLNRLFRRGSKKTSKLRVTGLYEGNSPVTGEFPAQRASNAEHVSIWWRHQVYNVWLRRLICIAIIWLTLETDSFVVTGDTVSCSYDNLQCHRWTIDDDVVKLTIFCFQCNPPGSQETTVGGLSVDIVFRFKARLSNYTPQCWVNVIIYPCHRLNAGLLKFVSKRGP